jgi:hypothetical protein
MSAITMPISVITMDRSGWSRCSDLSGHDRPKRASSQFGGVWRVEWTADRNRVKLEGVGVWVEMWVDAQNVHATGDIPVLGELLGGPLASGLKKIVQQAFQRELP